MVDDTDIHRELPNSAIALILPCNYAGYIRSSIAQRRCPEGTEFNIRIKSGCTDVDAI